MKQVRGDSKLEICSLSSGDNIYSAMWGVVLIVTGSYNGKDSGNLDFYVNSFIVKC